jgi:N-acetylneuraminic acid mutarotase
MFKNKLFIYGGHCPMTGSNYISDVKNDLFSYDTETKTWSQLKGPEAYPLLTEHTSVVANDKVYLLGGYSGGHNGYRMEVHSFNLSGDDWTCQKHEVRGELPLPRSAHTTVFWNDSLYMFGGWNGVTTNDDFYKLNLKKMKWKRVKDHGVRPGARRSHCAVVAGDSLYLFGGYTGEENCFPDLHRFDFVSKKWSKEEIRGLRLPLGRSRSRIAHFGNTIAISGGWDRVNHFQDWWEFDLNTKEWRSYPIESPSPLGQHTVDVMGNKAYIFGGFHSLSQCASDSLWSYSLGHLGRLSSQA